MLALTALLILHSVAPAVHAKADFRVAAKSHSDGARTVTSPSDSAASETVKGQAMSKIVVIPASAQALRPLSRGKSAFKVTSGNSLFRKLGGAFQGSAKKAAPAPTYTYPDSDFSFEPAPRPAERQQ